jgi:phenylacetate-CoA ligase
MFLHPHQVEAAMVDVGGIGRYQVAVRRTANRDELILRVEVPAGDGAGDGGTSATLTERVQRRARELWRIRPDRVETVPVGTLPEEGKVLVDERPWDG